MRWEALTGRDSRWWWHVRHGCGTSCCRQSEERRTQLTRQPELSLVVCALPFTRRRLVCPFLACVCRFVERLAACHSRAGVWSSRWIGLLEAAAQSCWRHSSMTTLRRGQGCKSWGWCGRGCGERAAGEFGVFGRVVCHWTDYRLFRSGKTTLLFNFACSCAANGGVAYFLCRKERMEASPPKRVLTSMSSRGDGGGGGGGDGGGDDGGDDEATTHLPLWDDDTLDRVRLKYV